MNEQQIDSDCPSNQTPPDSTLELQSQLSQVEHAYRAIEDSGVADTTIIESCLESLRQIEIVIRQTSRALEDLINARSLLVRMRLEMRSAYRISDGHFDFRMALYVYSVALTATVIVAAVYWSFNRGFDHDGLEREFIGVPAYVWVWSAIGSATAMLIRAGSFSGENRFLVSRWLLYRPIAGISTGVLLYLIVRAGLFVFTQNGFGTPRPELLYVLSYLGGFSDTISVSMMQRLVGQMELSPGQTPTKPELLLADKPDDVR